MHKKFPAPFRNGTRNKKTRQRIKLFNGYRLCEIPRFINITAK